MKLFYDITGTGFKKDSSGRSVWYPWGILGKGRILPDKETENRVRKFSARAYMMVILVLIPLGVFFRWFIMIIPITIFFLFYYLKIKSLAGNYIISTQKLTVRDCLESFARTNSRFLHWAFLFATILLLAAGLILLFANTSMFDKIIGAIAALLSAVSAWSLWYLIKIRRT